MEKLKSVYYRTMLMRNKITLNRMKRLLVEVKR